MTGYMQSDLYLEEMSQAVIDYMRNYKHSVLNRTLSAFTMTEYLPSEIPTIFHTRCCGFEVLLFPLKRKWNFYYKSRFLRLFYFILH